MSALMSSIDEYAGADLGARGLIIGPCTYINGPQGVG